VGDVSRCASIETGIEEAKRTSSLLRQTPHELLDQLGNALSDRFIGSREVLAVAALRPHRTSLPRGSSSPDGSQPMEITTSADSKSFAVTLRGFDSGTG
jgi:hypothetical protein